MWLVLITLALTGSALKQTAESGLWIAISAAAMMALEDRVVIDHFMEPADTNSSLRRMVGYYGMTIPMLLILIHLFVPEIAAITSPDPKDESGISLHHGQGFVSTAGRRWRMRSCSAWASRLGGIRERVEPVDGHLECHDGPARTAEPTGSPG